MTKKIKIYDLLPFMKKGWVAYDGKHWLYSTKKPNHTSWERWDPGYGECNLNLNNMFRLEPFKGSWQDSLILVADSPKAAKKVVNSENKNRVHKAFDDMLGIDTINGIKWYKIKKGGTK